MASDSWFERSIKDAFLDTLDEIEAGILSFLDENTRGILEYIIGTPSMPDHVRLDQGFVPPPETGAGGWPVWSNVYHDVYLPYVLPLTLGLVLVATAAIGIRMGAASAYQRKSVLRRLGLVVLAIFFWFPLAMIALEFFDVLGKAIAPEATMSELLDSTDRDGGLAAVVIGVLLALTQLGLVALTIVVFVLRRILLVAITVTMPLIGVFWALRVWPLKRFAGLATTIGGSYVGLLAAGLPAAVLLRVGTAINFQVGGAMSSTVNALVSLLFLPASAIAAIVTIKSGGPGSLTVNRMRAHQRLARRNIGKTRKRARRAQSLKQSYAPASSLRTPGTGSVQGSGPHFGRSDASVQSIHRASLGGTDPSTSRTGTRAQSTGRESASMRQRSQSVRASARARARGHAGSATRKQTQKLVNQARAATRDRSQP
jgi:hypothetical protein